MNSRQATRREINGSARVFALLAVLICALAAAFFAFRGWNDAPSHAREPGDPHSQAGAADVGLNGGGPGHPLGPAPSEPSKPSREARPGVVRVELAKWRKAEPSGDQRPTSMDDFVGGSPGRLMDLLALAIRLKREASSSPSSPDQAATHDSRLADRVLRSFALRHPTSPEVDSAGAWLRDLLAGSADMGDIPLSAALGYGALLNPELSLGLRQDLWREVERRARGKHGARLLHALSLLDPEAEVAPLAAVYLSSQSVEAIAVHGRSLGQVALAERISRGAELLPQRVLENLRESSDPDLSYFGFVVACSLAADSLPNEAALVKSAVEWRDDQVSGAALALLRPHGNAAVPTVVAVLNARPSSRTLAFQSLISLELGYDTVGEVANALSRGELAWDPQSERLVRPD